MGKMLNPKNLDSEELASAILEILSTPKYSEKALELQLQSRSVDAIDNISNIVMSYCH
jgi:UDP:flavonoid glycosyltransferase YjiC (YdhE family)